MKKSIERNFTPVQEEEIISMFYKGVSIKSLTDYVGAKELSKTKEARYKVEATIYNHYIKTLKV